MVRFYKIQKHLQSEIDDLISDLLENADFPRQGIKGYIVDSKIGQSVKVHNGKGIKIQRLLSVPLWVYEEGRGQFVCYVAHELAHQYANSGTKHNRSFYRYFSRLCPSEYQHYEFPYINMSQHELSYINMSHCEPSYIKGSRQFLEG